MEKFSVLKNHGNFSKTNKEQIVSSVCSNTGLSEEIVGQIFESQKTNGMPNDEIIKYFDNLAEPKGIITADEFLEPVIAILQDKAIVDDNKSKFTQGFLNLLNDNTSNDNKNYIDSVNLISIVRDILICKNPSSKEILSKIITTTDLSNKDFTSLNESFNMIIPTENDENTVQLYEGLKHILAKNNKRWGNAYHLTNSYNAIMSYIDNEIQTIQTDSNIVSINDSLHLEILNNFLTGDVNPIYRNFSAIKHQIVDSQTLIFDMVLLVHRYMSSKEYDLNFVSRQTMNQYKNSTNNIFQKLGSSRLSSKILNKEFLKQFETGMKSSGEDERIYLNSAFHVEGKLSNIFVDNIDSNKLECDTWQIPLKSVVDMLNFIKSASFEFNLQIRPVIRDFLTKAYELTNKVEKGRANRRKVEGY